MNLFHHDTEAEFCECECEWLADNMEDQDFFSGQESE